MDIEKFLTTVIDEGLKAAKADYTNPDQRAQLEGSIEGFEVCRGKPVLELPMLFQKANQESNAKMFENVGEKNYWHYRSKALEIEWVCNCVSAVMVNEGGQPLMGHLPTARGVMKAAEILAGKNV